jgi:hypothetical protein
MARRHLPPGLSCSFICVAQTVGSMYLTLAYRLCGRKPHRGRCTPWLRLTTHGQFTAALFSSGGSPQQSVPGL